MSYADYDLRTAVQTFGLTEGRDTDMFAAVGPLEPSGFLRVWLDQFAPGAGREFRESPERVHHRAGAGGDPTTGRT